MGGDVSPPKKPCIRAIDLFPVEDPEGGDMVALCDPGGVSDATLVVSHGALQLMQLMDGQHDVRDIQAQVMRATGAFLTSEEINGLVSALDEALFLEGDRYEAALRQKRADYLANPLRPAALAGASYPDDPEELSAFLDTFWEHPGGPDGPPDAAAGSGQPLRGLVAPHIDFQRGGAAYAHAYRALAERTDARLFVVFGTSHAGCDGLFGFTRKGYDTPLGQVPCDTALLDDIVARSQGEAWFAGDHAHQSEHSIEFQAVWLKKLWPDEEIRIVPILCGSMHPWILEGSTPSGDERVEALVRAVAEAIEARGEPAVVIAGADLAHIGPRFGDPAPPTDAELDKLARQDDQTLAHCVAGDAEGFFAAAADDGDARRICGISPIYMTLRVTEATGGEVLQYGQAEDPTGPSTVSFAALTLT